MVRLHLSLAPRIPLLRRKSRPATPSLPSLAVANQRRLAGPAEQVQPEHPVGVGTSRTRRACAPPPGRWSPASSTKHSGSNSGSSSIIREATTSAPGGGVPRRALGQPQAVDGASPGRGESEATASSSIAVRTTPPEAPHAEITASTPSSPNRAGGSSGVTTSATIAVRRSPRRKEPQVRGHTTYRMYEW